MARDKNSPKDLNDKDNSTEEPKEEDALEGVAEATSDDLPDSQALESDATETTSDGEDDVVDAVVVEEGSDEAEESSDEVEAEATEDSGERDDQEVEVAPEDDPDTEEEVDAPAVPGAIEPAADLPPSPPPAPPPAQVTSGPSTFALVFGGLLAGAFGFLVATFAVPEGWPNPPSETAEELAGDMEALQATVAELSGAVAEISGRPVAEVEPTDLSPLESQLQAISGELEALAGQQADAVSGLEAMQSRLSDLESQPAQTVVGEIDLGTEEELEAFRGELAAIAAETRAEVDAARALAAAAAEEARAEVEAAEARAAQLEAEALAAAERARQSAALAEISASLESGSPFAEALSILPDAPSALSDVATSGVPTLGSLRDEFPDLARDALATAQVIPSDATAGERLTAFLRRQTNARSLSPREGDDPDAVLSRAEAALGAGDLGSALVELAGLPEGAQAVLSDWIARAETRAAAEAAVAALSNDLN